MTRRAVGRILVVENYSDLAMVISATLVRRGYDCTAVHDPADAIEKLRHEPFASILLDITWPITTNPVLTHLREHANELLRHVIIMTGFDAHYLGLDDLREVCTFLRKPFSIDELFERLAHCAPPEQG